jgi:Ca2+/Na+ antiporter
MVGLGVGMLVSAEDIEPLALKVILLVIALCSAALGIYVLVPNLRRRKSNDGTDGPA